MTDGLDIATLDDLDPLNPPTESSTRSGGRINTPGESSSSSSALNPGYLTSRIPGEERRANASTLDETVWSTLSRDLLAIWAKMREVLYPRHLFGSSPPDLRSAYSNIRSGGLAGAREELVGLAGRAVNVDDLLGQAHMSEGLRNWDLWGPLIFVLLLSLLLSWGAGGGQRDRVFSGVFAMVWAGMAVVTAQIRLLGGNM